jgi:hypothetical protein
MVPMGYGNGRRLPAQVGDTARLPKAVVGGTGRGPRGVRPLWRDSPSAAFGAPAIGGFRFLWQQGFFAGKSCGAAPVSDGCNYHATGAEYSLRTGRSRRTGTGIFLRASEYIPRASAPDCRGQWTGSSFLLDLAGTKAAVVQQRAEAKDYLDIDALLRDGRVDLPSALAAACAIYGAGFNPQITLKALSFFGDGNLALLPGAVKDRLARAAREVDLDRLPSL